VKEAVDGAVANVSSRSAEVSGMVKKQVEAVKDAAEKKFAPAPDPSPETLTEKEREMLRQLNDMGFTDQEQLIRLIRKHKELSAVIERLIQ